MRPNSCFLAGAKPAFSCLLYVDRDVFRNLQVVFNDYKSKIHQLSNELFNTYKNVFIYKKLNKNEIPYHLKPLVYDIHKRYLNTKIPTNWDAVKDYIHTVPSKKLVFAMNYL